MNIIQDFMDSLQAFEALFNCRMTLHAYSHELESLGNLIQNLHNNPFCSYIKEKADMNDKCRYFDDILAQQLLATKKPEPYFKFCHAKLLELVAPVKCNNALVGLLYIGPFIQAPGDDLLPKDTLVSNIFCNGVEVIQKNYSMPELSLAKADILFQMAKLLIFRMEHVIREEQNNSTSILSRKELLDRFFCNFFNNSKCSLYDLANYLKLSESRTTQILREEYQESFPNLLNAKRIEYASMLLRETYFSASQIAILSGFSTPAYFYRIFKKVTNLTAGQYREKYATRR